MSKPTKKTVNKEGKKRKKENPPECPCVYGGQNCIILRRHCGDWVHEDDVLREAGLPVREHCLSKPTPAQNKAMKEFQEKMEKEGFDSITKRFKEDIG